MINNKFKINDSKTEFIVFRSPQAKQDLSGLSVIVGDRIIQQSSKVRLGIMFDQFLSFYDYVSSVCRSTNFHLRNIGRIRHLLSQNATAQLIHAPIAQSVSALDFNFERAVEGLILSAGKRLSLKI